MVAAELRDHPYAPTQILVIRNYGPTIARDVQVTFEPPIPDPEPSEAAQSVTPFLKRRYEKPIPALTPGMELDNLWYVGRPSADGSINVEPTPDQVTVHLSYTGPDGSRYEDSFPLDVEIIKQRTYSESSTSPQSQTKEALKLLKGIEQAVRSLVSRQDSS